MEDLSRACGDLSSRAVRLTKFKNIWKLYLPHNAVMKISSDLCDTCQQNNNLFFDITLVPVRAWKIFLETCFGKIPNLTKYHHFRFSSSKPGKVFIIEFPSSAEFSVSIIKDQEKLQTVLITDPEIIRRPGLSAERTWYLYEKVRQHCEGDIHKDTTCPKTLVPKPRSMKAHKLKSESD